jgi:16S rRNA (guanine(966)-N(2))-methyltransferase RsmD
MRERVFAVLGERVAGAQFLDLFAGTGAVGLEALSRGAKSVVFVEKHRAAAHVIEENSRAFDLDSHRARLMVRPVSAAVRELSRRDTRFDIAWLDPPFEIWYEGLETVVLLFETGVLKDEGVACLECPAEADIADSLPPALEIVRDLAGGASRVVRIESREV